MQNLQHILETDFKKGMNNQVKPEYVKPGQVVKALNCLVGDQKIAKGPGASILFNMGYGNTILGGISTKNEIYVASNEPGDNYCYIYRYTGAGNPVAVSGASLTKDLPVEFVDTGNAIYVFNGTDTVGKLVGATYTTVAAIPKGRYAAYVNNRLYVAGVTGAVNTLYYSDANAPETHGGSSNIIISDTLRSTISGLNVLSSNLVIGRTDNVMTFAGFTIDSFAVKNLVDNLPNFGSRSHRAMVNIGDDLIFLSYSGGTPHFRSLKLTTYGSINDGGVLSEDIEETMKSLNPARLNQVAGGFDGRYAYWSAPTGSSLTNNITIVLDTFKDGGWTIHENLDASVFFRSDIVGNSETLYFGSSNADSTVMGIDYDIFSRGGSDIPMEVISRVYRQQATRKSKNKYLYTITGDSTAGDICVEASPDGYTWEEQGVVYHKSGTSVFPFTFPFNFGVTTNQRERINLKTNSAYTYQLRFTEESSEEVVINEWDLYYYNRYLRDI